MHPVLGCGDQMTDLPVKTENGKRIRRKDNDFSFKQAKFKMPESIQLEKFKKEIQKKFKKKFKKEIQKGKSCLKSREDIPM